MIKLFQVSWIRHEDLHILTVGRYTYTADMRFHSKYNSKKDEWRLEIGSVQKHDSGRYECQVNTQPVRSFFVQLKVVGKQFFNKRYDLRIAILTSDMT